MAERADAPMTSTVALLWRFWEFARAHRRWFGISIAMIPFVAAMSTIRPLLIKQAVDVDLAGGDYIGLRVTGLMFLGAVVAEFLCLATQVYAVQRAGHATISDLRRYVFRHVLRLPARFFDEHPVGSLLSRTTSDVEALGETLSFGVATIITDAVMILAFIVAMFALDAKLAMITIAMAPLLVILVRWFSAVLRRLQLAIRKGQAVQTGYLAEQLTGISVVQLFQREEAAAAEYERLGNRYLEATKRANIFDSLLYALMDGIAAMAIALLIYFAAPDVAGVSDALTIGVLFAFVDYLQRIFVPIRDFSGKLATIQRAVASLERIYALLDEPTEERGPDDGSDPLAGWAGGVRVRDLHFRYRDGGPEVLRGVNFDIAPGEVIAVVGRTGSGKTTLGRVLTRVYDGYDGEVELLLPSGPTPVRSLEADRLRRHILLVQQDVFMFDDDVAFNVSLGETGVGEPKAIVQALRTVQAQGFVTERGGLEFEVGERGANLSTGEAQLVAFARVAARSPTLLILDEATASVDSMTEQRVQTAIAEILRGRSVLVIAHRLSTVARADKILVFSEGRIAERGTHHELLERNGLYAELYRMGFREPSEEDA